jgi:hypothetical protein
MSRRQNSEPSAAESYKLELRDAMSRFLPHQGLPLLTGDGRVRWTARLLTTVAILMAWSSLPALLDRFGQARAAVVDVYRTRRRPGRSAEGFFKALVGPGAVVLAVLCEHWRRCVRDVAGHYWKVQGWSLFGVDGSKFDCPRTAANEKGFGVSGKNNSGPQQRLTCLFHVAVGMLWGWRRDGIEGDGERTQLKSMLDLLPTDAMLLADAGFSGYDLFKALLDRGNSFLIRVGSNVKLIQHLGYARIECKQTVYLWPLDKQGRNRRSMPRSLDKVRPPLVLRLIELTDAPGKKMFLLTNVACGKLSDRAAASIYRLRWGIEVMWRGLKQTMGHHKLLSRTPQRAGAELDWAMAGLWMLQLLGGSRMIQTGQSPCCHSPAKALRVVRSAVGGRRRHRRQSLSTQLGLATKDTYRRTGSKRARHFPRKRSPRPPGAPEARMASAIEKRLIQRILEQPPPESVAA